MGYMNLIKKLFGISDPPEVVEEPKGKYNGFDIHYFPITGRYYPRYQGKYLSYWSSGYWTLNSDVTGWCRYGRSEKGAKAIIDEYLEYKGVGTKIIKL